MLEEEIIKIEEVLNKAIKAEALERTVKDSLKNGIEEIESKEPSEMIEEIETEMPEHKRISKELKELLAKALVHKKRMPSKKKQEPSK